MDETRELYSDTALLGIQMSDQLSSWENCVGSWLHN